MGFLVQSVDIYCERTDPSYWSEPINAISNAAFLLAAIIVFVNVRKDSYSIVNLLCVILFLIGIGSFLFHTHGTVWASIADVIPIVLFILTYLYGANVHIFMLSKLYALIWVVITATSAVLAVGLFRALPFFSISAPYWPIAILLILYAALARSTDALASRGLLIVGILFIISLTFRSVDQGLCEALPWGTHFVWHILNAIVLGWLIRLLHSRLKQKTRNAQILFKGS